MGVLHPRRGPHPIHRLHRGGAAAVGGFLVLFAVLGLAEGGPMLSTEGTSVLGMSSNGLLSVISSAVGITLVVAAARGGPTASTVSIAVGSAFLVSAVGNLLVLGTAMNVLAFEPSNIVFSIAVGLTLLILGSYGRISAGLPPDSPYYQRRPAAPVPASRFDVVDGVALAEAERARALGYASDEQLRRLAQVHRHRSAEDRHRAWRESAAGAP